MQLKLKNKQKTNYVATNRKSSLDYHATNSRSNRRVGSSPNKYSAIQWNLRPTRSNLVSRRLAPKQSTSTKTSWQIATKYSSSLKISLANNFATFCSVELIEPDMDKLEPIVSNSIMFFAFMVSVRMLKKEMKQWNYH